jgi:hypothetical protein
VRAWRESGRRRMRRVVGGGGDPQSRGGGGGDGFDYFDSGSASVDRLDPNPLAPFCIQTTVRVARGNGCLDDRELGRNQHVQSKA